MKVRTEELNGAALNWAIWQAQYSDWLTVLEPDGFIYLIHDPENYNIDDLHNCEHFNPAGEWELAGALMTGLKLAVTPDPKDGWRARDYMNSQFWIGPTPQVAICRAAVGMSLGDEVDVPAELVEGVAA